MFTLKNQEKFLVDFHNACEQGLSTVGLGVIQVAAGSAGVSDTVYPPSAAWAVSTTLGTSQDLRAGGFRCWRGSDGEGRIYHAKTRRRKEKMADYGLASLRLCVRNGYVIN